MVIAVYMFVLSLNVRVSRMEKVAYATIPEYPEFSEVSLPFAIPSLETVRE
jgi:hypothetical protein